jgi:DNA-directed RNA polymerase alpha subunit
MQITITLDITDHQLEKLYSLIPSVVKDEALRLVVCERTNNLLNTRIDELECSCRLSNLCRCQNIRTLGQLAYHTREELLSHKNFGPKSLSEASNLLKGFGLEFRQITSAPSPSPASSAPPEPRPSQNPTSSPTA